MNVKLSHTTAPCQILRCALTLWVPICVTVNKDTEKSMVHVKVWIYDVDSYGNRI